MNEAIEAFRGAVTELEGLEGLTGGTVLADPGDGIIISMTVWATRAAMESSEVKAAGLRHQAVNQVDGTVVSVHSLDVVADIGGTAPTTT